MAKPITLYNYNLDYLLDNCRDPITFCRIGVLKLAHATQKDVKRELLEKLIKKVNEAYRNLSPVINSYLNALEEGLKQNYESRLGGAVYKVRARAATRLIIHSKNDTSGLLFEYGTILHPIFGVPYLPASSLKGVLRSYLESTILNGLSITSVDEILGSLEQASLIVFTDGYPTKEGEGGKILEPEVTTPIYQEDIEEHLVKPTPIIYPAVAEGVEFTFLIAAKKEAVEYFDRVKGWIKTAFWEGVGAKTMLGYGVLEVGR